MAYKIYQSPGWHGEPSDPVIHETDDEREASLMAGRRVDIKMPGGSNRHDCYALDSDGDTVAPTESFACDGCGELHEWGDDGPQGAMDGRILECAEAAEKHLVTWLCCECVQEYDD